jgi:hypothetical protein
VTTQKKQTLFAQLWIPIIAAVIASVLTSVVVLYTFKKQINENEKQFAADEEFRLNENLNKVLDIELQYPFLEDSTFIAHWERNRNLNNDSAMRYLTYCAYVFNTLQNACEYYNYDLTKMNKFMDVGDLIVMHRAYWNDPVLNKSELPEFRTFVNKVYASIK